METTTMSPIATHITPDKLFALVRGLHGDAGLPSDDGPEIDPHSPLGPIARAALKEWSTQIAHLALASEAELNPQPLPPRSFLMAILAQTVVSRAELLHELASAMSGELEKRGIIIVSGYVAKFVQEVREAKFVFPRHDTVTEGNRFGSLHRKIWIHLCLDWPPKIHIPQVTPPTGPFPPGPDPNPRTGESVSAGLSATDLVLLGTAFAECARNTFDPALRQVFNDAAVQLAEAGAARL